MNKLPFVEKYRPKKIEDILLPTTMYNKITTILKNNRFPNLIINGIPGTGKTSTILCIARSLYGKNYKDYSYS